MDDAVFGEVVMEKDAQFRAALHAQDRTQVVAGQVLHGHAGAAQELTLVTPDIRLRARQDLDRLWGGGNGDLGIRHKWFHLVLQTR